MKPTTNEIEIAKKIVNDLVSHNFFEAILSRDNEPYYEWCDSHKNYLESNGLSLHCGETKACIISNKLSNWVIKVGFVGMDDYHERSTDFCAIEEQNYQNAVKEGLEEFFAASYELCSLTPPEEFNFEDDVTFYIQEWAEPDEEKTSCTCQSYLRSSDGYYDGDEDEDTYYDPEDEDRIYSLFGDNKRVCDLFDFICNWNINDLHSGNFGYTINGTPKIIDYSGY